MDPQCLAIPLPPQLQHNPVLPLRATEQLATAVELPRTAQRLPILEQHNITARRLPTRRLMWAGATVRQLLPVVMVRAVAVPLESEGDEVAVTQVRALHGARHPSSNGSNVCFCVVTGTRGRGAAQAYHPYRR